MFYNKSYSGKNISNLLACHVQHVSMFHLRKIKFTLHFYTATCKNLKLLITYEFNS